MKYFVDTSFWCALYDAKDENHYRARQYWQSLSPLPVKLFTSDYIFDETVTVARSRMTHHQAVELGEALLNSKVLTIVAANKDLQRESWELFKNHEDKGFSFTDCTSFRIMKAHSLSQVLAFDHHFAQMGFSVNECPSPQ